MVARFRSRWAPGVAACFCLVAGDVFAQEGAKQVVRDGAIAVVAREVYMPCPREGQSYVIGNQYAGHEGVRLLQVRTLQVHDDVYQDAEIRFSTDNGKTWTPFQRDPERDIAVKNGYAREPYLFGACYDPQSKRMVRTTLLRTHKGDPRVGGLTSYSDHTLWQTSADDGATWDAPKLLKYEDGGDYPAEDFGNAEYLGHNQSYSGYNVISLKEGGVATGYCRTVSFTNSKGEKESVCGVVLAVGRWDQATSAYQWTHSSPVAVSLATSDRGLMEPWVAQLSNGEVLVDMRGNATKINPGRNFYALSKDGGKTLGEARELTFDDGEQFYAPSSLSMVFRHSKTGVLYWFGNLSDKPTSGNSPRYPLYIAEIDETKPAIIRKTLTVIDDYDPKTQTAAVQFSNFSLVENRETHDYDLYMTVWGEFPIVYQANVYKYAIKLKPR